MPLRYCNMIGIKDAWFKFGLRKQMVLEAIEHGNKPTARKYKTTVKTVRKWVARHKQYGVEGLKERKRTPHHIPHKTSAQIEKKVIAKKKELKGFGVARMVREFDLKCGKSAAYRIVKEAGLLKKRKKKRERRNDLGKIKAQWKAGEVCCVDTKDLTDMPAYWTQMKQHQLPQWQYTFREVRSGLMFLGYSRQRCQMHAILFAQKIGKWLRECGMNPQPMRWQTDGGTEFVGSWHSRCKAAFVTTLEEMEIQHFQIPKTTYNADVETVHNLIELEFFDIESFSDRRDFFRKANTYQAWFNCLRKNGHKQNRCPREILQQADRSIDREIGMFPVLDLDLLSEQRLLSILKHDPRGYLLPRQTRFP